MKCCPEMLVCKDFFINFHYHFVISGTVPMLENTIGHIIDTSITSHHIAIIILTWLSLLTLMVLGLLYMACSQKRESHLSRNIFRSLNPQKRGSYTPNHEDASSSPNSLNYQPKQTFSSLLGNEGLF